jgi:2-amino-4-hydroxy-6-hydroxymethyldihydropteridine diphosphokinase
MQPLFLLLGSNCNDRLHYIRKAKLLLERHLGKIVSASSVYETMPWGNEQQPVFFNQALIIFSDKQPSDILRIIKQIETTVGRTLSVRWGPREIDIDILLYGNYVGKFGALTIPHLHLAERRFALIPLCEIAADVVHPVLHKTISELVATCPDMLGVKKL